MCLMRPLLGVVMRRHPTHSSRATHCHMISRLRQVFFAKKQGNKEVNGQPVYLGWDGFVKKLAPPLADCIAKARARRRCCSLARANARAGPGRSRGERSGRGQCVSARGRRSIVSRATETIDVSRRHRKKSKRLQFRHVHSTAQQSTTQHSTTERGGARCDDDDNDNVRRRRHPLCRRVFVAEASPGGDDAALATPPPPGAALDARLQCAHHHNVLGWSLYDDALASWIGAFGARELFVTYTEELSSTPLEVRAVAPAGVERWGRIISQRGLSRRARVDDKLRSRDDDWILSCAVDVCGPPPPIWRVGGGGPASFRRHRSF